MEWSRDEIDCQDALLLYLPTARKVWTVPIVPYALSSMQRSIMGRQAVKVEYIVSNRIEVKEAELFRVGGALILQVAGSKIEHRIVLSDGQWAVLAESAKSRAAGGF